MWTPPSRTSRWGLFGGAVSLKTILLKILFSIIISSFIFPIVLQCNLFLFNRNQLCVYILLLKLLSFYDYRYANLGTKYITSPKIHTCYWRAEERFYNQWSARNGVQLTLQSTSWVCFLVRRIAISKLCQEEVLIGIDRFVATTN